MSNELPLTHIFVRHNCMENALRGHQGEFNVEETGNHSAIHDLLTDFPNLFSFTIAVISSVSNDMSSQGAKKMCPCTRVSLYMCVLVHVSCPHG